MNSALIELLSKAQDLKLVIDGITLSLSIGTPSTVTAVKESGSAVPNIFRLEAGEWHIRFNGHTVRRKNSVGLRHIHELLRNPHAIISPTALLTMRYGESVECMTYKEFADTGYAKANVAQQQCDLGEEVLPTQSRARLLQALKDLKEDLACLQESGDVGLAFEKQQEIEQLEAYLRKSTFRGRSVRFTGRSDRDRKKVSVGIARAIEDLRRDHSALARHLDNCIRTGKDCQYVPESEIQWLL